MVDVKKTIVRILSALIPVRTWRKAFRKKLQKVLFIYPSQESINYAISNEMRFDVNSHWFWQLFNTACWEPETHNFYKTHVHPMKEVIDIGGWMGPTMLIAYSYNPKKIHVVEADPANYQILKTNCHRNFLGDKVILHNFCISDTTGDVQSFGYTDEKNHDSSTKALMGGGAKSQSLHNFPFRLPENKES